MIDIVLEEKGFVVFQGRSIKNTSWKCTGRQCEWQTPILARKSAERNSRFWTPFHSEVLDVLGGITEGYEIVKLPWAKYRGFIPCVF
jgi:hypothetical protein